MRDAKLPADDARTDTLGRQLHDLQADVIGQWPPIDKHAP